MVTDLSQLEHELKQRFTEPYYPWGRKQSDDWDGRTNFIYQAQSWNELKLKTLKMHSDLYKYAVNRWFNFWSARGIEAIFCQLPGVVAAKEKDRLKDFMIQGIPFDHKTTVFPKGYGYDLAHASTYPDGLAKWLYENQSTERRYHLANRLFVVLYASDGQHWKLKAELRAIKGEIERYIMEFHPTRLIELNLNGSKVLTDIIWFNGKEN